MAHKLSRDQKRKKKLAQREKPAAVEPYEGHKYKAPEYVNGVYQAELAIFESYIMTKRQLTDRQAIRSLEYLVLELRGLKPPLPANNPRLDPEEGSMGEQDMVATMIRTRWKGLAYSTADFIGILRTILGSANLRMYRGGYLAFLERFMKQMGTK